MVLDLAALDAMDFSASRPGGVDPDSCPACAMVVKIAIEAAATKDEELALQSLELGTIHAMVSHRVTVGCP
ncbi:hypothetical protein ACFPFX_12525 [Streptomyces mauvecolor]|uniref:Uncharacterized protein n=1 Tax=Streptomyces mauvecolor TaxID=58345 RepID=A0ABV9ULH8_9ACTN